VVSCLVAAIAWWVTHRLERGVRGIEAGLHTMEQRLESSVKPTGIPELDRVAAGINQLAASVEANQRERTELEARLHRMDRLAALGRLVAGERGEPGHAMGPGDRKSTRLESSQVASSSAVFSST